MIVGDKMLCGILDFALECNCIAIFDMFGFEKQTQEKG
jgi:hypothetical protein